MASLGGYHAGTTLDHGAPALSKRPRNNAVQSTPKRSRSSVASPSPPPQIASRLLSLPGEIRNRIYAHALASRDLFAWPNSAAAAAHDIALGLLTTSRQVYSEAIPFLYTENVFLFAHPSDITVFRIVASHLHSARIRRVILKVREGDVRLWTSYLSSTNTDRSLRHDLPSLKELQMHVHTSAPRMLAVAQRVRHLLHQMNLLQTASGLATQLAHALGGQQPNVHVHNALLPSLTRPPQPLHPSHDAYPTPNDHAVVELDAVRLRWARENGIEALIFSLRETRPPNCDVLIVGRIALPVSEVERLYRLNPVEFQSNPRFSSMANARDLQRADVGAGPQGNDGGAWRGFLTVATKARKMFGADVCLELHGYGTGTGTGTSTGPAEEITPLVI